MIRIAIVDDDREDLAMLRDYIRRCFQDDPGAFTVTAFTDGEELLAQYDSSFDILLLDVEMRRSNGIEVARAIRERDGETVLLFISRVAQYAVQGYSVDAMDYILKPVEFGSFEAKLRKAVNRVEAHRARTIQLAMDGDYRWLLSDEIRYVEVYGHLLVYHTAEGDYRVPGSIGPVVRQLTPYHFVQCTRFLLVNLKFVTGLEGDTLLLGRDRLPVSRRRRRELVDALLLYNGGSV